MKLYFIRHGESEANTRHIISNRASPYHLTERGRQQAQQLAERLADVPIDAIFSSPVLRARETAQILSTAFGVHYQVTEGLREYDCGILEERCDAESWALYSKYYKEWTLHQNWESKPEGGENFLDIRNRFLPFIESLKDGGRENILLIGHGGLFQLMLPLILTNVDSDFVRSHMIHHTEPIIADLNSEGWVCRQWGDENFG